jgi:hypothetical protein
MKGKTKTKSKSKTKATTRPRQDEEKAKAKTKTKTDRSKRRPRRTNYIARYIKCHQPVTPWTLKCTFEVFWEGMSSIFRYM